jgi:DNA (cytosine-5)-methyltransferase 1
MGAGMLRSAELCAGGGGAALGLEQAGFAHEALVEIDLDACATLRLNRPAWKVIEDDVQHVDGRQLAGIDLLSGGPPCSPFTAGGRRLGADDDRDMLPSAMRIIRQARPRAILLENVPGLLSSRFALYRHSLTAALEELGYAWSWRIVQASRFGVPQQRLRAILIAAAPPALARFRWPGPQGQAPTVGETLGESMAARGWEGAPAWAGRAAGLAPTLAGGSHLHGGPDLGPARSKRIWRDRLAVNAFGLADQVPGPGEFDRPPTPAELRQGTAGLPKLTTAQAALLQGFPPEWTFAGGKTSRYRQVGNALPAPVAKAVGRGLVQALPR